jgi:hypothetical protein
MATTTGLTAAAGQLGAVEARRLLGHPVYAGYLVYLVYYGIAAANQDLGPPANAAYGALLLDFLLVYAPATLIAGNRIAAATYRSRVCEPFDCTPVDGRQRTVAAILGLLCGPVMVGLATALVLLLLGASTTPATNDPFTAVYQRTAAVYLQLPALVLGAGLLGIAVARWLPWPGALPLASLAVVIDFLLLYQFTDSMPTRTWFALWPVWVGGTQGMLPPQPLHQEMWHLAYLLGLGVLAGVAALLRTHGPRRALWGAAAATAVLTLLAAWLQLGR